MKSEKRKREIDKIYFSDLNNIIEKDVAEIFTRNEKRREILEAINMLDDRYRNAIYLVKIEELKIQEVAEILDESVQNIKNLIHRGKKELRKILIKKGFDDMNKAAKVIIMILSISIILAGGAYAVIKISQKFTGKVEITPIFTSGISTMDTNKVWVRNI